MDKISATIITHNEEANIERCLNSLQGIADEIIVVDSFSDDRTLEICRRYNCKITCRAFTGFGSQRQYATGLTTNKYVLSIDADEVLTEELRASLLQVKRDGFTHRVYAARVCSYFCGREMHHSGWAPAAEIRLFNKRYANWNLRDVAEKVMFPDSLMPALLGGEIHHYRCASLDEFAAKEQRHARMLSRVIASHKHKVKVFAPTLRGCKEYLKCLVAQKALLDGPAGRHIAAQRFATMREAYRLARRLIKHNTTSSL